METKSGFILKDPKATTNKRFLFFCRCIAGIWFLTNAVSGTNSFFLPLVENFKCSEDIFTY